MPELDQWQRNILHVLTRLAQLRREPLDLNMLQASVGQLSRCSGKEAIKFLTRTLHLTGAKALHRPDEVFLPLLVEEESVWSVVYSRKPDGKWATFAYDDEKRTLIEVIRENFSKKACFFRLKLTQKYVAGQSPSLSVIVSEIFAEKRGLFEIITGSVFISIIALVTSLYSMQVYDRVVPTGATATLLVLTLGSLIAALFDAIAKWSRSHSVSELTDRIDQRLARSVYARFLGIRLDALPSSVGVMAQRMRSYEAVRQFVLSATTSFAVDIPLAVFLLMVFAAIGGILAVIPAIFLGVGVLVSLFASRRIEDLAKKSMPAHNLKMGHLVESVEGAEIIKSGNGAWRMLARWLDLTDQARSHDREMKDITEGFQFFVGLFQQISYTMLIALGALAIGAGSISMGGLIACSILSGRILSPLAVLPNLIIQWANTKASLQDLDRFWRLQQDLPEGDTPIYVERINGNYQLEGVSVDYGGVSALALEALRFGPGESVAIVGPIGSGKTTLLRLLSGLYAPQRGRVSLDGMNIGELDKNVVSEQVAFVPQDGRLFAGTLRDNLLIGMDDPGDEAILDCCRRTGLFDAVVASHPKGLSREIHEGGLGLSGGQKQLVHITRAMLRGPRVWLLDEPTASMDVQTEARVISALRAARLADPTSLFVFVTHKHQVVSLVDRVLVLQAGRIVADGPRSEIFNQSNGVQDRSPNMEGAR